MSVATVVLVAAVAGCGSDRDDDPRPERGVVAEVFALQTRTDGNFVYSGTNDWQRPGATILPVEPSGQPQDDIQTCDYTYSNAESGTYVLGADIDSMCFVNGGDDNPANDCIITTGSTRYSAIPGGNTMLGGFVVTLINNSLTKTQNMAIDGMGVNIRIVDSAGAEVWNLTRDHLDYQDLAAEADYLLSSVGGDACKGAIRAISDSKALPVRSVFGTTGEPFIYALTPANSEDFVLRFFWNGKNAEGNDVPAGTYTAKFDLTITDVDAGTQWESPADITFTISDPDNI